MRQRAGHKVPGIEIVDRSRFGAHALGGEEFRLDCRRDAGRDLVLQRENIGQLAVVSFRPDVVAGHRIQELAGDAHALSALADASLKNVTDAKLAPDLLHVHGMALVNKGRIASDDEEPAKPRQCGNDVFGDAVAEIFLLGIARHIGEGQNRDRGLVGEPRRRRR